MKNEFENSEIPKEVIAQWNDEQRLRDLAERAVNPERERGITITSNKMLELPNTPEIRDELVHILAGRIKEDIAVLAGKFMNHPIDDIIERVKQQCYDFLKQRQFNNQKFVPELFLEQDKNDPSKINVTPANLATAMVMHGFEVPTQQVIEQRYGTYYGDVFMYVVEPRGDKIYSGIAPRTAPHIDLSLSFGERSAEISDCGKYRYVLTREWDESKPKVMFVMLNPSTADADKDDPTIRRCIGFAKDWGYGGLIVCNLFAYRATKPETLLTVDNPFGDKNIWHSRKEVDKVEKVICAWGNEKILDKLIFGKGLHTIDLMAFAKGKLHYLKLTKSGTYSHPLYLPKNLKPQKL